MFDTVSLYVIGTELTRGIIKDSHIPLLTAQLTQLGYTVRRAEIVPDDGTIGKSLEMGASDSSCILVTGGLGPTSDDLTRSLIAQLAGVSLVRNQQAYDHLYSMIGERIHGANEQQVMIPEGFDLVENPKGTAPGFKGFFENNGKKIFIAAMPGPPAEMQPMFYNHIKPYMATLIGARQEERDEYSVYLIGESRLEELCQMCAMPGISWGTRFQAFKISLYVSGSTAENRRIFIEKLRKLTGKGLVADGGDVEALNVLCDYLKENHKTVSTAESCTSGFVSKQLTDLAGSSQWFWGGVASYDNMAKQRILGVSHETLEKYGAVSEQVAIEMAQGIRSLSDSDISISLTGIAGPDGAVDGKPLGTCYIGFSSKDRDAVACRINVSYLTREACRRKFTVAAFILATLYAAGDDVVDTASSWLYI